MLNFYVCKVNWNYFHSSISSHTFQEWIRKSDAKSTKTNSIFFFIYLTFNSSQPQKFRLQFTYFTHKVIIPGHANIMSFCSRGLTVHGFCYSSWKPLRKISWEYWGKYSVYNLIKMNYCLGMLKKSQTGFLMIFVH